MPEIRLGSAGSFPNINLGSVELQEIWLGAVPVWLNNQGPIYVDLSWDGTDFIVPGPMDFNDFTGAASSIAALHNGPRTISLVIGNISDPDNDDPLDPDRDWIVGYRLKRPDGTYAAGDPNSVLLNPDTSPIGEYGTTLPGTSSMFSNGEFTQGDETDPQAIIQVQLRDTNANGDVVDSTDPVTGLFVDNGAWVLTVVDSKGSESSTATMTITLTYSTPAGNITATDTGGANVPTSGAISNPMISNTDTVTFRLNDAGGALSTTAADQFDWSCTGNCVNGTSASATQWVFNNTTTTNRTQIVYPPNQIAGTASPATFTVMATGRAWPGNAALVGTINTGAMSVAAGCTPSVSVGGSTSPGGSGSYTGNDGCPAGTTGTFTGSATISCSGTCTGFSTITTGGWPTGSFTNPSPVCPPGSTGAPPTARVSVSGNVVVGTSNLTASGSGGLITAGTPSTSATCNINPGGAYNNSSSSMSASSSTCDTSGLPTSFNFGAQTGVCVLDDPPIGGSVCASGQLCGNWSANCGTIAAGGTANVNGSGCESPSFPGVDVTINSFTANIDPSFPSRWQWQSTVTKTSSVDTSSIFSMRITAVCETTTSPSRTSTDFFNLGNGFSPLVQSGSGSDSAGGGDIISCSLEAVVTSGSYSGSVTATASI